ncbi:MAG: hypothetical protein WCC92_18430 [Candidatus Korobacteraceae bacterium]
MNIWVGSGLLEADSLGIDRTRYRTLMNKRSTVTSGTCFSPGDPDLPDHDPDLKLIWSEAERAMADRDVLVFLGYSAPKYDSFAAQFFKRVAVNKRIEVYNRNKDHLSRFEAIFGSSAQLVPQTFEDSPYGRPRVGSE